MDSPIFISFYTAPYTDHAFGLVASLEAFGLVHDVRLLESGGSWIANVNRKAPFILTMMRRHPGRKLVWLDADARVRQYPGLFDTLDCDFAAHWRHGAELLSGTMFFSGSDASRRLCETWHRRCVRFSDVWDQVNLQDVLADRGALRLEDLPASYTAIFDDAKMGPAVIEHLQASRQLRRMCV
jgi:hypothetical protein